MTVVLVVVDGLRPDAVQLVRSPHIDHLMYTGAHTLTARSVTPSITLPAHMSAFYSVEPSRHGVLDNHPRPAPPTQPGLLEQLALHGRRAGTVFSWEPLRHLGAAGSLTISHFHRLDLTNLADADHPVVDVAVPLIESGWLDFLFVYLGATDEVGHEHGWMTDEYLLQIEITDGQIGRLVAALGDGDVILVSSDHGGHDRGHGTDSAEDMTVPLLLNGAGVRRGVELRTPVTLLDIAPTVAALLGIPAHQGWEGRVLVEALKESRFRRDGAKARGSD